MAFLDKFTKGARGAHPFIISAVRLGLNQSRAIKSLRAAGFKARTSSFNELFKAVRDSNTTGTFFNNGNPDDGFNPFVIQENTTQQGRRYSYQMTHELFNPRTNEFDTKHTTIISSQLLHPSEVIAAGQIDAADYHKGEDIEILETTIDTVHHSKTPLLG